MSETTFETARRCPKCNQPGEETESNRKWSDVQNDWVEVKMIYCRTTLCPWENTPWVVQVNSDGTVPQPGSQLGEKQYPKLSQEMETKVMEALHRQVWDETHPDADPKENPYR